MSCLVLSWNFFLGDEEFSGSGAPLNRFPDYSISLILWWFTTMGVSSRFNPLCVDGMHIRLPRLDHNGCFGFQMTKLLYLSLECHVSVGRVVRFFPIKTAWVIWITELRGELWSNLGTVGFLASQSVGSVEKCTDWMSQVLGPWDLKEGMIAPSFFLTFWCSQDHAMITLGVEPSLILRIPWSTRSYTLHFKAWQSSSEWPGLPKWNSHCLDESWRWWGLHPRKIDEINPLSNYLR